MAGKYGSPSILLLVDGYNLLAAALQTVSHKISALQTRTDGIGDTSESHGPTGMSQIALAQSGGFFNTEANNAHAALESSVPTSAQAAQRLACCGFAGQEVGAPFYGMEGAFSFTYEVLSTNGELTKANAEYLVNGQLDRGAIVQPLATKTASWNTKTLGTVVDYTLDPTQRVIPITSNSVAAASVVTTPVAHGLATGDIILISGVTGSSPTINGQHTVTVLSTTTFSVPVDTSLGSGGTGGSFVRANSSGGGVGYQQITALSGFTGFIGKIRDSADDITFADLVTFADVTAAPDAERATVTGTIDRYLSFDGAVTGTGSITAFAGFARS